MSLFGKRLAAEQVAGTHMSTLKVEEAMGVNITNNNKKQARMPAAFKNLNTTLRRARP
jgi:hypothetical protein